MGEGHHRFIGFIQPECTGKVTQVCYAVFKRAPFVLQIEVSAFGVPHIELVDSDNTPRCCTVHTGIEYGTPQIRPGGVAVYAQDRADRVKPMFLKRWSIVEVMPPSCLRLGGPHLNRGGGRYLKHVRVARINARPLVWVIWWLGLREVKVAHILSLLLRRLVAGDIQSTLAWGYVPIQ